MAKRLLPFLLFLAVCAVFAQTAWFEFLRFDDPDYTFRCPFVAGGLSWGNIAEAFRNVRYGGIWMPITWITYMVDISLFGPSPAAHHAVNVVLHALNAVLLFLLCRKCAPKCGPIAAALAAAFWALHPQRAEAVAWIASRKELVWTAFTLGGLIAWKSSRTVLACVCCALACMGKPTAMVFPLLAFVVEPGGRAAWKRYIPLFAMAVITGTVAMYSQTHPEGMAVKDLFYSSLPERLLNAVVATGLYLMQMVFPVGIHLDYRAVPGFPLDGIAGFSSFLVAVAAVVFIIWRGWKEGLRWTAWFVLALLPTLGLFGSFGEHARADRFLYVPAMAFSLAVCAIGCHLGRMALPLVVAAIVVCVPVFRVTASYRNDFTAFSRTVECDAEHGRALQHVGSEYCARLGDFDKGIEFLRRSMKLRPRQGTAGELAFALATRGRREDVPEIWSLGAEVAKNPASDRKGLLLEALGMAAIKEHKWPEAIRLLSAAVRAPARLYPADDALARLGTALANSGRTAEAEKLFAGLVRSKRIRQQVRDFAERSLETLAASSSKRVLLFY